MTCKDTFYSWPRDDRITAFVLFGFIGGMLLGTVFFGLLNLIAFDGLLFADQTAAIRKDTKAFLEAMQLIGGLVTVLVLIARYTDKR